MISIFGNANSSRVVNDRSISETDRLAIVRARKGQGLFEEGLGKIESKCRITGVENPVHLVASHCKPWRDSTLSRDFWRRSIFDFCNVICQQREFSITRKLALPQPGRAPLPMMAGIGTTSPSAGARKRLR